MDRSTVDRIEFKLAAVKGTEHRVRIDQAIDCVENHWDVTCPVGQKQAATVLAEATRRLFVAVGEHTSDVDNEMDMLADDSFESLRTLYLELSLASAVHSATLRAVATDCESKIPTQAAADEAESK